MKPLLLCSAALCATLSASPVDFNNAIQIPASTIDLYSTGGGPGGANVNRFGGFSDIFYQESTNTYYALQDRGAGGGTLPFNDRLSTFMLDVNSTTGAISNFRITNTIALTNGGMPLNGLNPLALNGNAGILGNSFDPEGLVVAPNGHIFIADEYGPAIYEFDATGSKIREFTQPDNVLPLNGANPDFFNGRGTITTGRQDNRGYEGLTISPDGQRMYAILQDPLVNEGSSNDGRRSPYLRIVEFDVATGQALRQFAYQLESVADINARIPGTANDFSATDQGRSIGVSAIVALDNNRFLVIERDNRGVGVADPLGALPAGSKRVFEIDITNATDISGVNLANTNSLPPGVNAVEKSLHVDVQAALDTAGLITPEKLEGLALGPQLADGSYLLLLGTDGDFSVTQDAGGTQFDVCSGNGASSQVTIDGPCPSGQALLPNYLYSFRDATAVPEPSTWLLSIAGVVLLGVGRLRMSLKRLGS